MIRNTAREIAVHLAYELSFTDKTVKELLDERLTKEYFDTLKDEDDIYEKAPGAAQTEYIRSIVSGVAEHAPELDGYIAKYAKGYDEPETVRFINGILGSFVRGEISAE